MARRHWVFGIAATIIGVVCIVFIVTSIGGSGITGIFRSSNVSWTEYGWRVLNQTVDHEHIRILAKLEAKKIPRLKVEHVVGQDIFLLCEYVRGDYGSFAQKFDPSTGSAVAYLNPGLFVPAYDWMLSGEQIDEDGQWVLPRADRMEKSGAFSRVLQVCFG
jgi:hypothetical protein